MCVRTRTSSLQRLSGRLVSMKLRERVRNDDYSKRRRRERRREGGREGGREGEREGGRGFDVGTYTYGYFAYLELQVSMCM